MSTIDIGLPCNDEMAAAAASEDIRMTMTQPLAGSSYTLGDRQDRVLTIDAGNVKITSICAREACKVDHRTLGTLHVNLQGNRHRNARSQPSDTSGGLSCTHWQTILRVRDLWVWICWHSSILRSIWAFKGERASYSQWNRSSSWRVGTSIRNLTDYSWTTSKKNVYFLWINVYDLRDK